MDKHSSLRDVHVSNAHTTRASRTQKNPQLRDSGGLYGSIVLFHDAIRKGRVGLLTRFDQDCGNACLLAPYEERG